MFKTETVMYLVPKILFEWMNEGLDQTFYSALLSSLKTPLFSVQFWYG